MNSVAQIERLLQCHHTEGQHIYCPQWVSELSTGDLLWWLKCYVKKDEFAPLFLTEVERRLCLDVCLRSKGEVVLVKLGVATALSGYPIKDGIYRVFREPVDGSET